MANKLAEDQDFVGKVLFLEHDVDDRLDTRPSRWWARARVDNPELRTATLPFAMVDSGRAYSQGTQQPFESTYRAMIAEGMSEPALASIDAQFTRRRSTATLLVDGTITNIGDFALGYDNTATLWLLAFENNRVKHTDRFVRRVLQMPIEEDIAPGASQAFSGELALPDGTDLDRVQVLVMVEFKPVEMPEAYRTANSALAIDLDPGPPATEVPPPTPDRPPTAEPSGETTAFLPIGYRRAPVTIGF